jgi:hypothetical protein
MYYQLEKIEYPLSPMIVPILVNAGAVIRKIIRIERQEKTPFLFEDADFSVSTIKNLIRQGEEDMEKALMENR